MKRLILLTISIILFNSCEEQEEQLTDELAEENSKPQNIDTKSTDLSHLFNYDEYFITAADYNRDGYEDLWGIKFANTRTGYIEVHILDGKSGYRKFLWQRATILRYRDGWSFRVGDYNRDRRIDLWAFRRNGAGTKKLEVHILDGANKFSSWITNRVTPHPELNPYQTAFPRDYNNDGWLDVYILNTTNWPNYYYDILDGKVKFKRYLAKGVSTGPVAQGI